MVIYFVLWC